MAVTARGSCLCGAVTYTVTGALRPVIACHCQQCRKTSGHHVAATAVKRDALSVSGDPVWYQSSSNARRGFCGVCGSSLFWDSADETISIMAGTLDEAPGLALAAHIFCADKGAYYAIADGLPQSDSYEAAIGISVPEDGA